MRGAGHCQNDPGEHPYGYSLKSKGENRLRNPDDASHGDPPCPAQTANKPRRRDVVPPRRFLRVRLHPRPRRRVRACEEACEKYPPQTELMVELGEIYPEDARAPVIPINEARPFSGSTSTTAL